MGRKEERMIQIELDDNKAYERKERRDRHRRTHMEEEEWVRGRGQENRGMKRKEMTNHTLFLITTCCAIMHYLHY